MLIEIILVVTTISLTYPPTNGNSYGNSYNPNKNMSSDLENVLKEFISSQKAFNKTVEEKLEN